MLMPIQFPDDLVIANDRGVEEIDAAPVTQRSTPSGNWIEAPIDWLAEEEIVISEQPEMSGCDRVGLGDQCGNRLRPPPTNGIRGCRELGQAGKGFCHWRDVQTTARGRLCGREADLAKLRLLCRA